MAIAGLPIANPSFSALRALGLATTARPARLGAPPPVVVLPLPPLVDRPPAPLVPGVPTTDTPAPAGSPPLADPARAAS